MKIFLLGFMGAGKSYWGRLLADKMRLPYYDLDEVIVEEEGKTVSEIFGAEGEEFFRGREKEKLQQLARQEAFIISCGGGTPCFFDNMQFMNETGITVWLNPSIPAMIERIARKKHKRPLIKELDGVELKAFVEKKLAEREPFYRESRLIIDTANESVDGFAEKLYHA